MNQVDKQAIQALLNEGSPLSTDTSRLSPSYGAAVAEQLAKYFAGNPAKPGDAEFRLMVATWTETLQDVVPEYRLADVFVWVRRNRSTTFQIDVSEICSAWKQMKEAERSLPPPNQSVWAKDVCKDCNGTGTKLVKRMDFQLGREYTYGEYCDHR